MKIGIIGGTGPQGQGIAMKLAKAGYEVLIGSRSNEKAHSVASDLNEKMQTNNISGDTNNNVISSVKVVFLTIPYENVESTVQPLIDLIKDNIQIFIDVTVPMKFEKGYGMKHVKPEQGSMSALISGLISPVPVVGAFKTIGAHALLDITKPLNRDTFVYGPKTQRKEVIDIISKIEDLRAIDAGPLDEAETIERLVPFLININRRYKVKDSGIKVVM